MIPLLSLKAVSSSVFYVLQVVTALVVAEVTALVVAEVTAVEVVTEAAAEAMAAANNHTFHRQLM